MTVKNGKVTTYSVGFYARNGRRGRTAWHHTHDFTTLEAARQFSSALVFNPEYDYVDIGPRTISRIEEIEQIGETEQGESEV